MIDTDIENLLIELKFIKKELKELKELIKEYGDKVVKAKNEYESD